MKAVKSGLFLLLLRGQRALRSDDPQPVRLLPCRRLPAAILPIVGRASGATDGGNDLSGREFGKAVFEKHAENVISLCNIGNAENKSYSLSAMPIFSHY
jgi:hypothetical protein